MEKLLRLELMLLRKLYQAFINSFKVILENKDYFMKRWQQKKNAYTGLAEPLFRRVVSHPSGIIEPPFRE